VVTTKYAIFIMRADNKGEGGIMALMALALQGSKENPKRIRFIITVGLLGTVLFYGDSIITPAISYLAPSRVCKLLLRHWPIMCYRLPSRYWVDFSFCKQKAPVKWASYFRRSCVSGFVYLPF